MGARILHVDLDAFFVEVCRQRHPELRDVELLVVGGRRDQRGVVQSASYGARRYGIHAGMPIAQAVRLCPQATFFQGSFPHYRDASRAVRAGARALLADRGHGLARRGLPRFRRHGAAVPRLAPAGRGAAPGRGAQGHRARLQRRHRTQPDDRQAGLGRRQATRPDGGSAGLGTRAFWRGCRSRRCRASARRPRSAGPELGLVDVWQIQQMEERALERLIGPEARALKRRAEGYGGTTLQRRPAAAIGEPRDHALARRARPRGARGHPVPPHRPGGGPAPRRGAGGKDRQPQAAPRRFPHGDAASHASRWRPIWTASCSARPASSFGRAFADVRGRDRGVRLIGIAATNLGVAAEADLFEPAGAAPAPRALGRGGPAARQVRLRRRYAGQRPRARRRPDRADRVAQRRTRSLSSNRKPTVPSGAVTCGPRSRKVALRSSPGSRAHRAVLVEAVVADEHPARARPHRAAAVDRALQTRVGGHAKELGGGVGDQRGEVGAVGRSAGGGRAHAPRRLPQHGRPPHSLTHRRGIGRQRPHELPLGHQRAAAGDTLLHARTGRDGPW